MCCPLNVDLYYSTLADTFTKLFLIPDISILANLSIIEISSTQEDTVCAVGKTIMYEI